MSETFIYNLLVFHIIMGNNPQDSHFGCETSSYRLEEGAVVGVPVKSLGEPTCLAGYQGVPSLKGSDYELRPRSLSG